MLPKATQLNTSLVEVSWRICAPTFLFTTLGSIADLTALGEASDVFQNREINVQIKKVNSKSETYR